MELCQFRQFTMGRILLFNLLFSLSLSFSLPLAFSSFSPLCLSPCTPPWNRDGSWGPKLLPPPIACAWAKVVNYLSLLACPCQFIKRPSAVAVRLNDFAARLQLLPSFLGPCSRYWTAALIFPPPLSLMHSCVSV